MPVLMSGFETLPPEYQRVLIMAQEQHQITIASLQTLVGGWSGAMVFLVSIAWNETRHVEHCILKLDRKSKTARSDEVTRHASVIARAAPEFARTRVAELVFDRVEQDGAIAIFYRIAGQSLVKYRPLSNYERQSQLQTIFTKTNSILLSEWNTHSAFIQAQHPQKVLEKWLGFRLEEGSNAERFIRETCKANPDASGLLVNGHVFPNPLLYARRSEPWGKVRAMDVATGFIHGDLNTNNILVKFADDKEALEGYYLIDFALFKEDMPLLYDQRYLEMSYLMHAMSQISFATCIDFLTLLSVADIPDPRKMPIEMTGIGAVIASARYAFAAWVQEDHPSLHDDLWGQYWLAGVAAGLAYCHKAGQPDEQRLAGLIYAAANLRRFVTTFKLPLPTEVEWLYDKSHAEKDSPGKIAKKTPHNLPVQPTPFIGRAAQVTALKELILSPETCLVTLMGPGGTGKTRLSLQVAQEVLDHFAQGVYFVPLADDTTPNQFVSRVAQQLDVREGGRPLLDNVKDYLRDKHILLVLDNFEQLISAAPTVAELLSAAPHLKVLTSSRIALKLQSEHEYHVSPLETPQRELTLEELTGYESVRLFVDRARSTQPNFSLTKDNASFVTEICIRLDGLPLALELAAARIKLLSPQAILSRLDDQLKLLTGGARDRPTRHQTLRNTLEWSYSLLNEDEKKLYARLGVFVGGFTLEAAEAVCNAENKFDILEGLTALADNSLLRQEEMPDGESRFSMLETIRAYAVERIVESDEMPSLQAAHAQYFGDIILNQAGWGIYSPKSQHWLTWYERELDNIRATLNWCLAKPPGSQLGVGLTFMLFWFWYRRGHFIEGLQWVEKFLALPDVQNTPPMHATALACSGMLALWQGQQETALTRIQEALAIQQRLEDDRMMAMTQMAKGIAFINMGRDSAAKPLLKDAQALFEEQNMPYFHALTAVHLGNVELGLGNVEQARLQHEMALSEARTIHENWILSFALNNLGEVARTQGRYDLARKYYEECQSLLNGTGDEGDGAHFVHSLGYIAQHEEDFELAEAQFRKSLAMFRRLGNRRGIAECLAGLAGLKARQGQTKWGAVMLSAAETVLKVTGGAWWPADRVEVERNRAMVQSALTAEEFAKAQKVGEAMNMDQAIAFASEQS